LPAAKAVARRSQINSISRAIARGGGSPGRAGNPILAQSSRSTFARFEQWQFRDALLLRKIAQAFRVGATQIKLNEIT
jgi:hypothetical protein